MVDTHIHFTDSLFLLGLWEIIEELSVLLAHAASVLEFRVLRSVLGLGGLLNIGADGRRAFDAHDSEYENELR